MGFMWMLLFFAGPGLVLPLILGIRTWTIYVDNQLGRTIALFTLKPLLATPMVLFIIGNLWRFAATPLGGASWPVMVPGALLTMLLITLSYRPLRAHARIAAFLLAGDVLRWVFPYIILLSFGPSNVALGQFGIPYPLIGGAWIWTSAYAMICWFIAKRTLGTATLSPV